MSETLYNKYRPITFDDVAQPHVVRVFKAQIAKKKNVNTYLISGPTGTGKTTLARIMAMALLCTERKDGESEPCGKCKNCTLIKNDNHRDVLEIDCAQNGKVEDVRDLISEKMRMAPEGEYLVIIMDESHMMTVQAMNALLKSMEEPPHYVVFFVCTSEPHKIIPAIRTRCQKHSLTRVSNSALKNILANVVEKEGVDADDAALDLIVEEASGSAREALVILELVSVVGVTEDNVREVLLRGPKALSMDVLMAIITLDRGEAYRLIDAAQKEGRDMSTVMEECARGLMTIARYMVDKTTDPKKCDPELVKIAKAGFSKSALIIGVAQNLIEISTKLRQNVPADVITHIGILKTIDSVAKMREAATKA